jgi:hypothetical protein
MVAKHTGVTEGITDLKGRRKSQRDTASPNKWDTSRGSTWAIASGMILMSLSNFRVPAFLEMYSLKANSVSCRIRGFHSKSVAKVRAQTVSSDVLLEFFCMDLDLLSFFADGIGTC